MSLFKKINIDPNLISLINEAKAIGKVKINNMGICSVQLNENNILLKNYEDQKPFSIPLSNINYISFDSGNFFIEPKLIITTKDVVMELKGVDDNDIELERFYHTLQDIKQPKQNISQEINSYKANYNMQQTNTSTTQESVNTIPDFDPIEEIKRYHQLKEDGIITEEEFNKKKIDLLK